MERPKREIVAIEEVIFCKNELGNQVLGSFQCAKVERTGQVKLISPEHVVNQACLVHDCSTGRCCFRESETTVTIEREPIKKVTYNFAHDTSHHYYLVNKFYLGESLKYFDIL